MVQVPPPIYRADGRPSDPSEAVSDADSPTSTVPSSSANSIKDVPTGLSSTTTFAVEPTSEKDEKTKGELSSTVEKGLAWEGYLEDPVPEKTQHKFLRNLRFQIMTVYRRLFTVLFLTNLGVFIAAVVRGSDSLYIGKIVVANLFIAILMRQDSVINAFYTVALSVPTSWPLWIRLIAARVFHIGGIHSGAAVASTLWFIYFTVQATIEFRQKKISVPTLVFTYILLVLLIATIAFAYPVFRIRRHDSFEVTHRFFGWAITALVWPFAIFLIRDYNEASNPLHHAIKVSPVFWMIVVATGSIIVPWLHYRKVPVKSEVLSNHAVRLYFEYTTPWPGSFTRISTDPLFEWHSFATIPLPGRTGYSAVVSRAGDWTSKLIAEPPSEIYVRGIPTSGVMTIAPLFRRVILVATGSGIGPIAPHVFAKKMQLRLLWSAPNVRQTFGDKLVDGLIEADPGAVIYDTRKHGKPDMVKLTYRMVREFNAEAVCIISNQALTRKVVYGMMSRGIPAFGAIWDS